MMTDAGADSDTCARIPSMPLTHMSENMKSIAHVNAQISNDAVVRAIPRGARWFLGRAHYAADASTARHFRSSRPANPKIACQKGRKAVCTAVGVTFCPKFDMRNNTRDASHSQKNLSRPSQ